MSRRSLVSIIAAAVLAAATAILNSGLYTPDGAPPERCERPGCKTDSSSKPDASAANFDYFVLALSWSPTFCQSREAKGESLQCDETKDFGFIVHGLWPNRYDDDLAFCRSREKDRVPDRIVNRYLDIMPSPGLIGHQWRKHGTCTGLGQEDFFALVRKAADRVSIPASLGDADGRRTISADRIEEEIVRANPGLEREGVLVTCEGGKLDEIRICMTPELGFRACPSSRNRGCGGDPISIPPIP